MEHTTFFEHYRVCTSEDESPQEVSRTGAAINYKAIDTRSHDPVQLQLIPVATIEPTKLQQLKERAETAEKLDHVISNDGRRAAETQNSTDALDADDVAQLLGILKSRE